MTKKKISREEYSQIEEQSIAAKEILESGRFAFLRDYLQASLTYIETTILENTICDVRETHTITDRLIKTFLKPKKEQIEEMSGQYKFIKKFLADLKVSADLRGELDQELEAKRVVLE